MDDRTKAEQYDLGMAEVIVDGIRMPVFTLIRLYRREKLMARLFAGVTVILAMVLAGSIFWFSAHPIEKVVIVTAKASNDYSQRDPIVQMAMAESEMPLTALKDFIERALAPAVAKGPMIARSLDRGFVSGYCDEYGVKGRTPGSKGTQDACSDFERRLPDAAAQLTRAIEKA